MNKTHRELYPEQYTHPIVGKRVGFSCHHGVNAGIVLRVFSTRFGTLAQIDTLPSNYAVPMTALSEGPF